jgi:predicted alpha/beta-fold hydrolase
MALKVEGIPQRETLGDAKRDALMTAMVKKKEDPSLLPITPATVIAYGRIGGGKSSIMYSWLKNMFPKYYDEVLISAGLPIRRRHSKDCRKRR